MRTLALTAFLLLSSCVSTPDVEGVIQGPAGPDRPAGNGGAPPMTRSPELGPRTFTRADLVEEAATRRQALDERCRALLLDARAEDATYEELMAASRALIFDADLRIQANVALRFDPDDLPKTSALIDAEDDVPSALKGEVRSLAQESRNLADRARELRPGDPAAMLFSTLGIGLSLWSMGPFQALTSGAITTLPRRIEEIAAAHPEFEGASPLRLKGRFASRAPWPYKDKKVGVETLKRAVDICPIPLNLLFLGDAHWINGDEEAALASWGRGSVANADMETEVSSPFLREICRLRVLSAQPR